MATKIRLQRFGKKGKPFFHVVVADARAPRDGKFIERLGSYNPNTNPATIEINFEKTLQWVNSGAQPTDTARAILSYKGVLYKKHLEGGVKKGALTQEQADEKFNQWLAQKSDKISGKTSGLSNAKADAKKAALVAEAKKKEQKAAAIAAKNTPVEEVAVAEEATEEVTEAAAETAQPVAEAETQEAAAPVVEEVKAEEPAAEAKTQEAAPVAEEVKAEVETEATPEEGKAE